MAALVIGTLPETGIALTWSGGGVALEALGGGGGQAWLPTPRYGTPAALAGGKACVRFAGGRGLEATGLAGGGVLEAVGVPGLRPSFLIMLCGAAEGLAFLPGRCGVTAAGGASSSLSMMSIEFLL